MATYNFTRLSSYDFEELSRDLLQNEWGARLESFTPGPDSGIDLRCLSLPDGAAIVQCKHNPSFKFKDLLRHLKRDELPKVQKLAPNRYVLATSVGLTPANKSEIALLFHPFVRSEDDIFGRDELNNLLRRHPSVETTNFKLWLTSTAVLQRVLHNAEQFQTEFELDRVTRKLPLFVQSSAFPRAQTILSEHRVVVISGVPGIGKTTLADMLLFAHLEQSFEPIVIQEGIDEAKKQFKKTSKQIFYFDDFLGQTFLGDRPDLINANQDAALVNFMEAVRGTQHSRFILTTREHILKTALNASERLARSTILDYRCVLAMGDYSFAQKSRILYNHFYFSDLPKEYKKAILHNEFYLDIIKHQNFNPRTVEWLSGHARVRRVPAEDYRDHVARLLNSPEQIWAHAFNDQISEASRNLLLCLGSLENGCDAIDLEPPWKGLHHYKAKKYNFSISPRDFRRAMDELEGSFIRIERQRVDFLNPSIRDFVANVFRQSEDQATDLLMSALRFSQIMSLRKLAEARPSPVLESTVMNEKPLVLSSIERVLFGPDMRWREQKDGSSIGTYLDTSIESRVSILVEWAEKTKSTEVLRLAVLSGNYLIDGWGKTHSLDVNPTIHVIEALDKAAWVRSRGGEELSRTMLDVILDNPKLLRYYEWNILLEYQANCEDWRDEDEERLRNSLTSYQTLWVEDEQSECEGISDLDELKEGLKELQTKFGLTFENTISSIENDISERPERGEESRGFTQAPLHVVPGNHDYPNDDDIRKLFATLVD